MSKEKIEEIYALIKEMIKDGSQYWANRLKSIMEER